MKRWLSEALAIGVGLAQLAAVVGVSWGIGSLLDARCPNLVPHGEGRVAFIVLVGFVAIVSALAIGGFLHMIGRDTLNAFRGRR